MDFSKLNESTLEERILKTNQVKLQEINLDLTSVEEMSKLQASYNLNQLVFVKNYPRNVKEALALENLTGGVNLFINFHFPQSLNEFYTKQSTFYLEGNVWKEEREKITDDENVFD